MRATLLAPGSRGDVQPYVALGQALAALGHTCTIVTTLDHEQLVQSHGLDVVSLPVNVAAELAKVETNRAVEGGGVIASFRAFADIARRASRAPVRGSIQSVAARTRCSWGYAPAEVSVNSNPKRPRSTVRSPVDIDAKTFAL